MSLARATPERLSAFSNAVFAVVRLSGGSWPGSVRSW